MPIFEKGRNGTENKYDTGAVIKWLIQREINLRIKEHNSETEFYDFEIERARLTHHQANMAAMDEQKKAEQLIPAEDVERTWTNLVMAFRSRMLAIPTKAAHYFQALTDLNQIQDCLREHIYEGLNELGNYDPVQDQANASTDVGTESGSGSSSATKTNGESVG